MDFPSARIHHDKLKYIISSDNFYHARELARCLGLNSNEFYFVRNTWSYDPEPFRKELYGIRVEHESQLIGWFSLVEKQYLVRPKTSEKNYPIYEKIKRVELLRVLPNGNYEVRNEGDPTDVWIVPKSTFDKSYKKVD